MIGLKKIIASFAAAVVSLTLTIPVFAAAFDKCDVNQDGSVTLADYTYMTMILDGYKPLDYNIFDVNENGVVSFADSATVYDYAWYGSNNSSASVANYGDLRPASTDVMSVSQSVTYWKHDCEQDNNFVICDEYTLTSFGDETSSMLSIQPPTNMTVDNNETAVVKITYLDSPQSFATGVIVDNHTIATAAHCVYDYNTGLFQDIMINIIDEGETVVETFFPKYIHIEKEYGMKYEYIQEGVENADGCSFEKDYALIYVEENLSEYGKFEMGIALDAFVNDTSGTRRIKVSGFPAQSVWIPENSEGPRYVSEGSIVYDPLNTLGFINYNVITYKGDSGGPAYIDETYTINGEEYNCKTMVGIHVTSNHFIVMQQNQGRACPITSEKLQFYLSNPNID